MASAFGPASAITRWPNGSKAIANGTVPGSLFTVALADRSPPKPTPNTSMALPLPLVVTTSWPPSGVKATCPGVVVNCGVAFGSRPSARCEPGMRNQEAAEDPVALHGTAVQRVEHVHQVAVDGHADREHAARAQHLAEREPVTVDGEDRDRIAARVHGVEQAVPRVVGQRALGRGVVDHGPGQDAAAAAGGVAAGRVRVPSAARS